MSIHDLGEASTEVAATISGEARRGENASASPPSNSANFWEELPTRELDRGAVVGRYIVLVRIGAGGMGVVYAAYDPELDRKVAIKLLAKGFEDSHKGVIRLQREAQALARLSHPNVVSIFDVGAIGTQVWLAMEFIRGETLREWLAPGHGWREVVAVLRQAGEGLAAAHTSGLLHRDFKPANVMVGADRRVRVMDFGLARVRSDSMEEKAEDTLPEVHPGQIALTMVLTRTGTIMGTPAYMAPEQFASAQVTAAADQFSFCVTLWEALFGERPFSGASIAELLAKIEAGSPSPPLRGRRAPGWLRRVIERGLARDPARRWPSMNALLEALARGESRARVRGALVGGGLLALTWGGVEGYRSLDVAERVAACAAGSEGIVEIWNDEALRRVREGLLATGVSYADTTAAKVLPLLDAQANAWKVAWSEACVDTRVRGLWDEALLERSMWCLDERAMELEALVAEMARADATFVEGAVAAAAELSRVETCIDADHLARLPRLPAEREAIGGVRRQLSRARALALAGKAAEGLEGARAALSESKALDWPPLTAEAHECVGSLLGATNQYSEAEVALEEAYFLATRVGAPDVTTKAATTLIQLVGGALARHSDGRRWARHAENALLDMGERDESLRRAMILHNLGAIERDQERSQEALRSHQQALSIRSAVLGEEHPLVAESIAKVADVQSYLRNFDEALALEGRALGIRERALGPDHPAVARSFRAIATIHVSNGALQDAKPAAERALSIAEKALGGDHPALPVYLRTLAIVQRDLGEPDEAAALLVRALAIAERIHGPEHPTIAALLLPLGLIQVDSGAYADGRRSLERVLSAWEKTYGPEDRRLNFPLVGLGDVCFYTGDYEGAMHYNERGLRIAENALGPDHFDITYSLYNIALIHWINGEYERAKPLFERALEIREKTLDPTSPILTRPIHGLAATYLAMGETATARALYERALEVNEKGLSADHPDVAFGLSRLAEIALLERRPGDAVVSAERALQIFSAADGMDEGVADARYLLARALWDAPELRGRDRERARRLATQALEFYRDVDSHPAARAKMGTTQAGDYQRGSPAEGRAEVEEWLRARGGAF